MSTSAPSLTAGMPALHQLRKLHGHREKLKKWGDPAETVQVVFAGFEVLLEYNGIPDVLCLGRKSQTSVPELLDAFLAHDKISAHDQLSLGSAF
jgi:hypothetical protein